MVLVSLSFNIIKDYQKMQYKTGLERRSGRWVKRHRDSLCIKRRLGAQRGLREYSVRDWGECQLPSVGPVGETRTQADRETVREAGRRVVTLNTGWQPLHLTLMQPLNSPLLSASQRLHCRQTLFFSGSGFHINKWKKGINIPLMWNTVQSVWLRCEKERTNAFYQARCASNMI